MSNTSKISRSLIAAFITVCMLMSLVPGGVVSATGEEATQYGIFNFDNNTGTGELRAAVSGEGLSGVFVQGPGSVDGSELPGMIVANNATILNGDASVFSRTSLLGDSSIKIDGYSLSSNMPAFTGAINLEGENAGTEVFDSIFTHIMTNIENEKLTVSILSNKTVDSDTNFCVADKNPTGEYIDTFEIGKNTKLTLASTVFMQVNDLVINEGGSIELGAYSTLEISGNSPLGLSGYITAAEGAHVIVGEYHMVYTNGQWEQFNDPNDFKGIQVRFDDNYITKIQYSLDNGSFADVPSDNVIPKDSLGDCSKITFKVVPKQNEENRNYVLEYVDNPDFEHEENWNRTRIDHNDGSDGITFNLERSAISSDKSVVDIFPDDGPQDPEGWAIYCDPMDVASVSYKIGSGAEVAANDDDVIAKDAYKNASSITFKVTLTDDDRVVHYRVFEFEDDQHVLAEGDFSKDQLSVVVSAGEGNATFGEKSYIIDIRNQGPQDPDGWAVYSDPMDIASVSYKIGSGTEVAVNDGDVIAKDAYKNASSITFNVTLTEDYRVVHYRVFEFENDQNVLAEGDFSKDQLSVVVSAGEGNATFGDKSYVIDIRNQGEGPNNDFEGVQVRFDDHVIAKVEYSTDGVNYSDLPEKNVISKDDIPSVVYFKVTPKSGEEDRDFEMGYIDGPDFETDERDWQWTNIEPHIQSGNILFAVAKTTITKDQFIVDFHTKGGGFDPSYKGIHVGYDDNRISNVQYSVDNGTFQDLPANYIIPADTVNSCTTNIRFKIVPQTNEENRNYVLDYVDGPDYSVGNETWVWNRITHDEGENYIFTVSKSLITKDQFDINLFADDGVNPPSEGFTIETKITAGRGNIAISPETVIIGDGWLGDDHMRYEIAYDDYDAVSVVITPHTDDVVSYAVKSISVSGIDEDDYEIANNVLTLKNKPAENTTIVITVEFEIPNSYILNDVAERGYAYTIITSNYSNSQDIIDDAKAYLTTELWNYYFDSGRVYSGIYSSKSALADSITKFALSPALPDNDINNPIDILDIEYCPYIDFKLAVDAENSIVLRVYLLQKLGFYVKTPKADNSGYDYYFAEYKPNDQGFADDIVLVYDHDVGSAQFFGNGVDMEGVIRSDSHDVFSGHVHQERTKLFNRDDANYISVRVVIVNIPNPLATTAVRVSGNRSCPGWEFDRMNIYTASANRGNATDAYIYIGSTAVELDEVVFGNSSDINDTITAVEIDSSYGLSGDIIKVTQSGGKFIVSFLDSNNLMTTNYDFIPLRLSIKDKNNQTTFKYLNLHRVALRIDKYNDGDTATLKGTYYYPTLKTAPSADDRVDLYVTVTKSDGSKETILIDGSSVQVKRSDDQEDNPNFNPYYSEFTVWTGSESDLDQIVKVEVIAISRANNTDTHFGGIKVGFNSGVVWVKG